MISLCGTCALGLRQVIKTKSRPQELKPFVGTIHDGSMIDFEVYKGAKQTLGTDL